MRLLMLVFSFCVVSLSIVNAQTGLSKLSTDSLYHLYEQGAYCDILEQDRMRNLEDYSLTEKLLIGSTLLASEKWDRLSNFLPEIEALVNLDRMNVNALQFQILHVKLLEKQERFEIADSSYTHLLNTAQHLRAEEPAVWLELLVHYGTFLYHTEQYQKAGDILDTAMQLSTSDSPIIANAYRIRALVYQIQAQYQAATDLHQRAIAMWEKLGWTRHPDYAESLNDFALLKLSQNKLPEAERLLEASEAINAKCAIPSAVAYNLAARGNIRLQVEDWGQAEQFFQEALDTFEDRGQHKETAILLNQLGRTYLLVDSLALAGSFFERALQEIDLAFPAGKSLYRALIIDGLAQVNDYLNESEVADSLYRLEQNKIAQLMGRNNVHYSTALNNQATLKEYLSENEAAVALYQKSLEIIEPVLGRQHPEYLTTLYNLARLFAFMGKVDSAALYYEKANTIQLEVLNLYFSSFDEQTRLKYRYGAMGNFDLFFNFACFNGKALLQTEIQEINLATKNLVLDYAIQTRLEDANTEGNKELRQQWLKNRELLARAFQMTPEERSKYQLSIDSLQREANAMERKLIRQMPGQTNKQTRWRANDLIEALTTNEAAVDFLTFGYHDGYDYTEDSLFYFALVSRSGFEKPELVYLTDNKSLEAIFDSGIHYTTNANQGNALFQLIWEPLLPWLKGVEQIHLSPDGLLYQVSFEGLFTDTGGKNTLSDQYSFFYYSNLRDFLQAKPSSFQNRSALLIGDPAFTFDSISFVGQQQLGDLVRKPAMTRSRSLGPFIDLAGTAKEIHEIEKLLNRRKYQISVFEGANALENHLNRNTKEFSPGILHLSTHGYSLSRDLVVADTNSLAYRYSKSENPMLRSGLAFAGANYSWHGGSLPIHLEDGILTAEEVANLDLRHTDIVVLSACETGLGKITDGEGVFGLQRAFKLAGANQLLISLWEVPDEHTTLLMTYFYRYLLRTKDSHLALRRAQNKMKRDYGPRSWAGFILFN